MFLNLIASTWEDQLLTIKTRVHRISKKAVSHLCKCFYSLHDIYEANTTRRCYHEGQWGEEEADDQFDVWLVAHHLAHALTEGNELGSFPRSLCHPTRRIREDSEIRGIDLVQWHCTICCDSDFFPEEMQYLCKNAIWNMQTIEGGQAFQGWLGTKRPMTLDTCSDFVIYQTLWFDHWVTNFYVQSDMHFHICIRLNKELYNFLSALRNAKREDKTVFWPLHWKCV